LTNFTSVLLDAELLDAEVDSSLMPLCLALPQVLVALAIFLNFIVSAVEAQVLAQPGTYAFATFNWVEVTFLCIFCVELGINMFATLFWEVRCDAVSTWRCANIH
jgi:hypothetical protein